MPGFANTSLTVAEAAYVSGVPERVVNHEIDAGILRSTGGKERRAIRGADLLYLSAVRDLRRHMTPQLRKRVREAIASAVTRARPVAKVDAFEMKIADMWQEVVANFSVLERAKRDHIESRPGVLAGEPVIRGTRIPARLVADLIKQGYSKKNIRDEYDLTPEQIDAAVIFDRVSPKRGRPAIRKLAVKKRHVPADR